MLQHFTKKRFLIDYLKNFVDMHNHILPGIDDGAKTVEDSLEMIRCFGELGVSHFIATPHIMHNFYQNNSATIGSSLDQLRAALLDNNLKHVALEAAAEHMIDDNFEQLLEKGEVMAMRKEFLLVEMSYLQSSINFNEAIQKTLAQGFYPILAHPERYVYLHRALKRYENYKKQGILFQLNLLSLGEYYSSDVRKTAHTLLQNGLIDFVATDVHNLNQLNTLKEIKISGDIIDKILPPIERTIQNFY